MGWFCKGGLLTVRNVIRTILRSREDWKDQKVSASTRVIPVPDRVQVPGGDQDQVRRQRLSEGQEPGQPWPGVKTGSSAWATQLENRRCDSQHSRQLDLAQETQGQGDICQHFKMRVILFSWFCNFCRKECSLIFKHDNFWEVPDELKTVSERFRSFL